MKPVHIITLSGLTLSFLVGALGCDGSGAEPPATSVTQADLIAASCSTAGSACDQQLSALRQRGQSVGQTCAAVRDACADPSSAGCQDATSSCRKAVDQLAQDQTSVGTSCAGALSSGCAPSAPAGAGGAGAPILPGMVPATCATAIDACRAKADTAGQSIAKAGQACQAALQACAALPAPGPCFDAAVAACAAKLPGLTDTAAQTLDPVCGAGALAGACAPTATAQATPLGASCSAAVDACRQKAPADPPASCAPSALQQACATPSSPGCQAAREACAADAEARGKALAAATSACLSSLQAACAP
jgi:hypothetical protein